MERCYKVEFLHQRRSVVHVRANNRWNAVVRAKQISYDDDHVDVELDVDWQEFVEGVYPMPDGQCSEDE